MTKNCAGRGKCHHRGVQHSHIGTAFSLHLGIAARHKLALPILPVRPAGPWFCCWFCRSCRSVCRDWVVRWGWGGFTPRWKGTHLYELDQLPDYRQDFRRWLRPLGGGRRVCGGAPGGEGPGGGGLGGSWGGASVREGRASPVGFGGVAPVGGQEAQRVPCKCCRMCTDGCVGIPVRCPFFLAPRSRRGRKGYSALKFQDSHGQPLSCN